MGSEPCIPRRGRLKNGNPPATPFRASLWREEPSTGRPCRGPAIHGKRRCRLHGGLSTGPRTPEGLERIRQLGTKHWRDPQKAKGQRRALRETRAYAR